MLTVRTISYLIFFIAEERILTGSSWFSQHP